MANLLESYSNYKKERELILAEYVGIIPSDLCFMSSCKIPAGTRDKNIIEGTVALALEESSPFNINDIFWGYTVDFESCNVQIFSALKSRTKNIEGFINSGEYILPEFIVPILTNASEAILKNNEKYVYYKKNEAGEIVTSDSIPEKSNIPTIELLSITPVLEFGLIINYSEKFDAQADPIQKILELPFKSIELYRMNMQDSVIKKSSLQNKLITIASNITILASVGLILLTTAGITFVSIAKNRQKSRERFLASKESLVETIKQKDERAHELDLFSNKKQAYFRGLEKINSKRPDSVTFNSLYASEGENFTIKGVANSLEISENFRKTLEDSSDFKTVRLENEGISDNEKINFSLYLTFNKL